jgi:hypothetical protein
MKQNSNSAARLIKISSTIFNFKYTRIWDVEAEVAEPQKMEHRVVVKAMAAVQAAVATV